METNSKPFVFLKNQAKTKWLVLQTLVLIHAGRSRLGHAIKTCYHFRLLIQRHAQFQFLQKSLRLATPSRFVYDFLMKILFLLCSINWENFVVWFPLLLEILSNMCIVIISCLVSDFRNYKIKQSFIIKPFFYIIKKLSRKCKYLKNEKSF